MKKSFSETKAFKKQIRFPRLRETTTSKLNEKILHKTFNKMATSRNPKLRMYGNFDVFRTKKADEAKRTFKLLAVILAKRKIEADTYIKVLCQYGGYSNSIYMPPPSWMVKPETLELFEKWLLKRNRNKYVHKEDWKQAISEWNIKDVYQELNQTLIDFQEKNLDGIISEYPIWSTILYVVTHKEFGQAWKERLMYFFSPNNKEFKKLLIKRYKNRNWER